MPATIRAESKSSVMAKLVQRFIRGRRFDPCPPFCLVARYFLRVEAAISPLTESPSRDNQILCHENHFCIGIYSLVLYGLCGSFLTEERWGARMGLTRETGSRTVCGRSDPSDNRTSRIRSHARAAVILFGRDRPLRGC